MNFATPAKASPAGVRVLSSKPAAVHDSLAKWFATKVKDTAPGLAIGVIRNGKVLFEGYGGLANLEHQIPVGPDTRFNMASVAKQFTALCILELAMDKKLSLEDDFREYLPGYYPDIAEPIRISQLLNHSSGIRDLYELLSLEGRAWWARVGFDMKDAMELLAKQQTLNNKPGEAYRYSNSGYLLLTEIVEKVSGIPFPKYAAKRFEALGLENTGFSTDYMAVIPNKALPYTNWGDGKWKQYPMVVDLYGDGFLYTTLKDQILWERLLQESQDMSGDVLMLSQQPIPGPEGQVYGYGLEFNRYMGRNVIEHAGATGSYGAHVLRFPESALSIVVMTSNGGLWAGGLAREIAQLVLEPLEEEKTEESWASRVQNTPLELVELEGLYYLEDGGTYIRIVAKEDGLSREIEGRDPVRLVREASNVFAYETFPELKAVFFKDESGQQKFELHQAGLSPREAMRLPAPDPENPILGNLSGVYRNDPLDLQIEVVQTGDEGFSILWEDKEFPVTLPANDRMVFRDYTLRFQTNSSGALSGLLLDTGRIRNLELKRQ